METVVLFTLTTYYASHDVTLISLTAARFSFRTNSYKSNTLLESGIGSSVESTITNNHRLSPTSGGIFQSHSSIVGSVLERVFGPEGRNLASPTDFQYSLSVKCPANVVQRSLGRSRYSLTSIALSVRSAYNSFTVTFSLADCIPLLCICTYTLLTCARLALRLYSLVSNFT